MFAKLYYSGFAHVILDISDTDLVYFILLPQDKLLCHKEWYHFLTAESHPHQVLLTSSKTPQRDKTCFPLSQPIHKFSVP